MRISSVVFYTLAALTAKDITQTAIASPVSPSPNSDPNVNAATNADTSKAFSRVEIEAIAPLPPPETLPIAPATTPPASPTQAGLTPPLPSVDLAANPPQSSLPVAITPPEPLLLPERAFPLSSPPPSPEISTELSNGAALLGTQSRAIPTLQPASITSAPVPSRRPLASTAASQGTLVASIDYFPGLLLAQTPQSQAPSAGEIRDLQNQLQDLETSPDFGNEFEGSPAITISNPSGFGADNFRSFVNFSFQSETRYTNEADGSMGIGIGVGDARETVGFQLSYTLASFGGSRDFGTGGFNAKLHRQFGGGWSAALGWEGFATTGDVDFEDSIYGSVTKIFRTATDLNDPFSRVALTAGLGNGRFRTEEDVADGDDTIGVFGSVAVRIARPVSAIVEWTGQDLAVGLSVTPFRNVPWVITPAVRDIAGAGDGARFVLGTGISFQF